MKTTVVIFRLPPIVSIVVVLAMFLPGALNFAEGKEFHLWEKVEIRLSAENTYADPYNEVEVWVDLEGPGFQKRCYGFWDGGDVFRIRILATGSGTWRWRSGSNKDDPGLAGRHGEFIAIEWTEAEKRENNTRRGMIKASANGHAFEWDDGTPFFLLGDTWWPVPTFRYRWYDDEEERPIGPEAGLKDYVRIRKEQGFNCIAMLASLGNWANDDQPAKLRAGDGTTIRSGWKQAGTQSAKNMHDEEGNRAFLFPGKVPGFEMYFPDVEKINPKYFQNMDKKIDYLNSQGFVPFIEVARRDIGQAWQKYYQWPDSYTRYIQYIWSRYQANICIFSPVHLDSLNDTIPAREWNEAANRTIEKYGHPPFATPTTANSSPSSLKNFGHTDKARWLNSHQIGNSRTHDVYSFLTEIFHTSPAVPGINGEPYYAGMLDVKGGTETSALFCRSAMYGSVLSGGLGGHIYGAGGWDGGLWSGEVEEDSASPIWEVITWDSANHMQHLRDFILSEGKQYQNLIPNADLVYPNKTGKTKSCTGWAYCARTAGKDLFLLYFEKDCPTANLHGAIANRNYQAKWFNPRTGQWTDVGLLTSDSNGNISLPHFPGKTYISGTDWAMRLNLTEE